MPRLLIRVIVFQGGRRQRLLLVLLEPRVPKEENPDLVPLLVTLRLVPICGLFLVAELEPSRPDLVKALALNGSRQVPFNLAPAGLSGIPAPLDAPLRSLVTFDMNCPEIPLWMKPLPSTLPVQLEDERFL